VGEEIEPLEYHADTTPEAILFDSVDVLSAEPNRPAVDIGEPVHALQQRRLARSARADDHFHILLVHLEADVREDTFRFVGLADAVHLEETHSVPSGMAYRPWIRSSVRLVTKVNTK
jgi:hypothetical protein